MGDHQLLTESGHYLLCLSMVGHEKSITNCRSSMVYHPCATNNGGDYGVPEDTLLKVDAMGYQKINCWRWELGVEAGG